MLLDPRLYFLIITLIFYKKLDYKFIVILFVISLIIMKYFSWVNGAPSAIDFSHFDYAMWNSFRSGVAPLSVSIQDTSYYDSLLGNHFAPFLFLPGIFVMLFSHHLFTVMLQPIAIVWAIYLLYKILNDIFNVENEFKELLILAFLGSHFMTRVYDFEFHHEIFYIPVLFGLFYELYSFKIQDKNNSFLKLILYFITFLSIKEDSVFIGLSFFIPFLFYGNRKKNIHVLTLILFSGIYFFLTTKFIMPLFQTKVNQSSFLFLWGKYGTTMGGVVVGALTHPHWIIHDIFTAPSFYKIFYPTLFISFMSFWGILPLSYLGVMLSSISPYNEMALYYSAPALPLIFIAFLFGLKKVKEKFKKIIIFLVFILSLTSGLGTFKVSIPKENFSSYRKELNQIINNYHDNGVILISSRLMAQVDYSLKIRRIEASSFARKDVGVIILEKNNFYPLDKKTVASFIEKARGNMKVEFENDQVVVFKS